MRIGIVSYWFNRGQATVSRLLRALLDELGHRTFVLARPTRDSFVRPGHVARDGVWNQPDVTVASDYDIADAEYLAWAETTGIEAAFFDQNYQFEAIGRLRAAGITTLGRFVWESFGPEHAAAARAAYSTIYSLTRCERERYHGFGIDSPYIDFGCPPELAGYRVERPNPGREYLYIGGYLSNRKPTGAAVAAFSAVPESELRLTLKTQRPLRRSDLCIPERYEDLLEARRTGRDSVAAIETDPRIRIHSEDLDLDAYYRLFARSDVSLAPSRWEGLGLHLFEALALGVPTLSCDIAPINEVIRHGVDGLLVPCRVIGRTASGIDIHEPELDALTRAIARLAEPGVAQELGANALESAEARSWERTRAGYRELLELAA